MPTGGILEITLMKKKKPEKTVVVFGVAVSFHHGNGAIKGAFLKEKQHRKPSHQSTRFAARYVVRVRLAGIHVYLRQKPAIGQEAVLVIVNCVVNY